MRFGLQNLAETTTSVSCVSHDQNAGSMTYTSSPGDSVPRDSVFRRCNDATSDVWPRTQDAGLPAIRVMAAELVAIILCAIVATMSILEILASGSAALRTLTGTRQDGSSFSPYQHGFDFEKHKTSSGFGQHFDGAKHDSPLYTNNGGHGYHFDHGEATDEAKNMSKPSGGTGFSSRNRTVPANDVMWSAVPRYCRSHFSKCLLTSGEKDRWAAWKCSQFLNSVAWWYPGGFFEAFSRFFVFAYLATVCTYLVSNIYEIAVRDVERTALDHSLNALVGACCFLLALYWAFILVLVVLGAFHVTVMFVWTRLLCNAPL